MPVLVEVAVNGTTVEARKTAMDELMRLADFADRVNAERQGTSSVSGVVNAEKSKL
jgi:hypothetical protein